MSGDWQTMATAPKVDGKDILALYHPKWSKEPRRRIIHWNDGIGKAGYTWECWMCSVCTIAVDESALRGWLPLPEIEGVE